MRIITRADWKARSPKSAPAKVAISSRTATCVHHDGPNPITVKTFAEACALVRRDQNFHMDGNGWADIGYNFLVTSAPGTPADGLIFEARGRDAIGAHCMNHNTPWIGIQVAIGGGQTPSPTALAAVRWLHDTLENAASHSLSKKVHSDGFPTACPDPKLRAWVKAGMPVTNTPPPPPIKTLEATMADLVMTNPVSHVPTPAVAGLNSMWAYAVMTNTAVKALAAKAGVVVDVDEKALAAALVASLTPALKAAVTAAVTAGGTPEAVADAVVAKLSIALAS